MKLHRRRRLYAIIILIIGVAAATFLAIYALGQNMNLYYTPSQIVQGDIPKHRAFKMGGMVVPGSVKRQENNLTVSFVLTDFKKQIFVTYTGILPALFREGQGIIVQGKLSGLNTVTATEVLAKHDEKYMPPNITVQSKYQEAK